MTSPTFHYEPGKPTSADLGVLTGVDAPVVYLDWNVFQRLWKDDAAAPLLQAVLDVRSSGRLAVPHSAAHAQDATAMWHSDGATKFRAERLRNIAFADGVTAGMSWKQEDGEDGSEILVLRPDPLWDVCVRQGHLRTSEEDFASGEPFVDDVAFRASARARAETIRASSGQGRAQATRELVATAMDRMADRGVPITSEIGTMIVGVLGPILAHRLETLPGQHAFRDAHPQHAVRLLHENGAFASLGVSLDEILLLAQETAPTLHRDWLGPLILGIVGYQPDRLGSLRAGTPGPVADFAHSRFAMASAVFVTADDRLARRIEAWAYWTGRGLAHGRSPVVCIVNQNSAESYERTAAVLQAVAASAVHEAPRIGRPHD